MDVFRKTCKLWSSWFYLVSRKRTNQNFMRCFQTSACCQHKDMNSNELSEDSSTTPTTKTPITKTPKPISESVKRAKCEALWGMFIGDALSMPVHWYYNTNDILKNYDRWISDYTAPKTFYSGSILPLSAADDSGRKSSSNNQTKAIIGQVILHDKLKFWTSGDPYFYHQGMEPGDNTLNMLVALKILQTMQETDPWALKSDQEVMASVLESYVHFMTTPDTHNDTYAESFHRLFFKDWNAVPDPPLRGQDIFDFAKRRSRQMLSQPPDSQLSGIGALVLVLPWVLRNAGKTEDECAQTAVEFIKLTHPVQSLIPFVDIYSRLFHATLNGFDLGSEVRKILAHASLGGHDNRHMMLHLADQVSSSENSLKGHQRNTSLLGLACYIESSMKTLLYLMLCFAEDFNSGTYVNTNSGGENCHRGAALGAVLGAASAQGKSEKIKNFRAERIACMTLFRFSNEHGRKEAIVRMET
uniref:ADP-ribosylglycohydrolase n=1 Tax=Octopus bimaculoides TaxID=37653 RepID=A0A0L8GEA0_OCTBM